MTEPASTAPAAAHHPHVQGRCPACRGASLFLGSGGYVTCARLDCPEPDAATTLLERCKASTKDASKDAPASLRDQYATAISRVLLDSAGRLVPQHVAETAQAVRDTTDAILAVRDTEMQQLRDQLTRVRTECDRLTASVLNADGVPLTARDRSVHAAVLRIRAAFDEPTHTTEH